VIVQGDQGLKPHYTKPASLFVIQDFHNWLEWFLNLPQVEAWISGCPENFKIYFQTQNNMLLSTSSHLQLAFTLFVDWYNLLMNRLLGKQHSMEPCFTYLATLIPSPKQPDMITIMNSLRLLFDKLLELNNRIRVKTHQFPNGRKVTIKLAVLIGDVVALVSLQKLELFDNNLKLKGPRPFKRIEFDGLNLTFYHIGVLQHHFGSFWYFDDQKLTKRKLSNSQEPREHPFWTSAKKTQLLQSFSEVVVPTGVSKLTKVFGYANNGKVKDSEWHNLFSIYLPLTFLDLILDSVNFEEQLHENRVLIDNTCLLVHCTNVFSLKTISEEDCECFERNYKLYSKTSLLCFPGLKVLPNHHFALHIPAQLQWWGPLSAMSEFPGERFIFMLQKFKTNSSEQNNGTVMKKFCKLQQLIAQQRSKEADIKTTPNFQMAQNGFIIGTTDYEELLSLCRQTKPELQSCNEFSNSVTDDVLSSYSTSRTSFTLGDGKKVAKKGPNNIIEYIRHGIKFYGKLVDICQVISGWDGVPFKIVRYKNFISVTQVDNVWVQLGFVHKRNPPSSQSTSLLDQWPTNFFLLGLFGAGASHSCCAP
ncbi:hypothetical protein VP01_3461g1, partial [Puccinia sorghi]